MRHNVVVIVMDTARIRDVFPLEDHTAIAPNLASLADEGVDFERAFSAAPWTLPSHASLFTATYPSKHGAHAGHKYLDNHFEMLPGVFQEDGYETVAVSNNTWISEEFGYGRGFETFHKTWQYVQSETDLGELARTTEGWEQIRSLTSHLLDGNPFVNVANAVYGKFLRKQRDSGARQTNEWISDWLDSRNADRPFFLFANYLEPHLEYRPPESHASRFLPADVTYEEAMDISQDAWSYIAGETDHGDREFEILRALYRGEIAYLDERIGELRKMLEANGEWEDTIFVVTGDHGENIGDHGLMDHQYCLYDTLLHVPLVIHGGPFTGGDTVDDLVQLTDLVPTLLDAAGIDAPEFRDQSQGQSFHPDADTQSREYAFAEYIAPQPSMEALEKRVGDLPEHVQKYDRSLRAIRGKEWKLIRGSDGTTELYNVTKDPEESKDHSEAKPDVRQKLESELDAWLDSFEHADYDGDVEMRAETKERLEDLGYLQ